MGACQHGLVDGKSMPWRCKRNAYYTGPGDEGKKRWCKEHRPDGGLTYYMPCPFPALVCGQGSAWLGSQGWEPTAAGGRLFLADGLFDISYGPCDIVLLDGNIPHGITNLRDLPGKGGASRRELERFSLILFSGFKRLGSMMKHGNYQGLWCDSYLPSVLWKE